MSDVFKNSGFKVDGQNEGYLYVCVFTDRRFIKF